MTDAPKTVGLVYNGFGGWRLWTADDADDPTVVAVPYLLAAEHERLMAERDAEDEAFEKDYSSVCEVCGANPVVRATGLCGPCTFGEADTADGNW